MLSFRIHNTTHLLTLFLVAQLWLCSTAAAALLVGIDPTLPQPTPTYIEDRSELEQKRFGKIRYQRVDTISKAEAWAIIIELTSELSRIELKLEPAKNQLDFELKLAKGHYDVAYLNPLQFVNFNSRNGYQAIAKRKSQPLRGLVVVKAESDIESLRSLSNKAMVFPGVLDFASSIAPRQSLKNLGIDISPRFVKTSEEGYQLVINGIYPSAAGTTESFLSLPPPVRNQLRIIWDTPGFTPHAFAVHSRVPFFSITRLQQALVGLIKTDQGRETLPLIHAINGFEVAKDADWHDAAQIDVTELNNIQAHESDTD